MYTTPEEAEAYVNATGVDALAVAIGSAHGVYKKKPMLNIERLKEIKIQNTVYKVEKVNIKDAFVKSSSSAISCPNEQFFKPYWNLNPS